MIPGGVNSPVRAFKAVGGSPRFIASAKGATITDVDGHTYIDYVMSWGPLIHGHAPPALIAAARQGRRRLGTSYGAPTELEVLIAEKVRALMPSIEMVRFTSSGTEATMSAVRVARAATGRDRVDQVRRLLPRPRRRLPGRGRLGRADARRADQPRRRRVRPRRSR